MTELRTDRLLLREWLDTDLEPFAALCADPVVMEHFPAPLTRAQCEASVARIRVQFAREGFGLWAVALGGDFIGFAGLSHPSWDAAQIEIGWRLARAHWGAGYATEAAARVVEHAFGALALPELVSFTVPANTRSQRVMMKVGFARDPAGDFDHPNVAPGHRLRPHWTFRRTRDQ